MAAAFPLRLRLRGAPLTTPHPSACSTSRLVVHASAALASAPRGGGRVGRLSVSVSAAAAGDLSGSAPIASGAPAWDALGGVSVLAAGTGDAVPLTDFWELASVLKDSMARFDSAGAKLIAIGVGTPDKARILADRLPFPVDSLYADPERKAKIYSRLDYIKKATKNYTLEGTPADLTGVLQQGGMFVFRGKELLYSWRDEGTGDHAPLDDVLSACRKIPPLHSSSNWWPHLPRPAIRNRLRPTNGHFLLAVAAPSDLPLSPAVRLPPRLLCLTLAMATPVGASLLPRVSLPPPARSTAASARGLDLCSLPARLRRGHLRLRRSPSPAGTAAASSPSVPSSSPDPGSGIGEALGGVEIYSAATGEPVLFRDLWDQNEGMAVVALLRHFGCPCCWELASVLRDTKERFDSAGVKLIAIGVGTPAKARILAERLPFPLEYLYADPERKVKVFSRFDSLKEAVKNYTIEATPDDRAGVLQQGGMFVFKGKELLYARKDEGTGDHAPLDDVLNICCKVPVA
ncbi:hypothetical protein HU200_047764 [Digitaria exilis]|uniref:Thioredoxin domain-containing protein n=1 Tax=Digitaria exilis TaxID=1010633 RepID=A0A835AWF4_9POAL|nr:hypothetical protein HU200_047764 [Digitaria exilis]